MSKQKYEMVFCVWEDIISSSSDWKETDDAIDWADSETGLVYQTGFVLEKNDEHLIIVDSFFPDDTTVGTVTRIPRSVIKQLTTIQTPAYANPDKE